ncbi:MAG: hypothetical protein ABIG03_04845 [Candidatus Eisenbacteria bacterium]
MLTRTLPKVMLGANPFHGVSYMGDEYRREYRNRFRTAEAIEEVIDVAVEHGIRGVHAYAKETEVQAITRSKERHGEDLTVVAVIPDIYGAAARETGAETKSKGKIKMLLKNMPSLVAAGLKGDLVPLMRKALRSELEFIRPTKPDFILLYGAISDIACATEQKELLEMFYEEVRREGAVPGMATHNFVHTFTKATEMGIPMPTIMAPLNPRGFMMNPSKADCERLLQNSPGTVFVGKKILAGGAVDPHEGFRYAFEDVGVESVAVGIGSVEEGRRTFAAARDVLGDTLTTGIDVTDDVGAPVTEAGK